LLPLIAQGLTNVEITAEQFITPKTVEHHLRDIYAKFGVSGLHQPRRLPGESRRPAPGSPTPSRPTQTAVRYVPALSTPARLRPSTHDAVAVCYRFVTLHRSVRRDLNVSQIWKPIRRMSFAARGPGLSGPAMARRPR